MKGYKTDDGLETSLVRLRCMSVAGLPLEGSAMVFRTTMLVLSVTRNLKPSHICYSPALSAALCGTSSSQGSVCLPSRPRAQINLWRLVVTGTQSTMQGSKKKKSFDSLVVLTVGKLWLDRNARIFSSSSMTASQQVSQIAEEARSWLKLVSPAWRPLL